MSIQQPDQNTKNKSADDSLGIVPAHKPHPAENADQDYETSDKEKTPSKQFWFWKRKTQTGLLVMFNCGILMLMTFHWWSMVRQVQIMRDQFRESQRSWIGVSGIEVSFSPRLFEGNQDALIPAFRLNFQNSGHSPALDFCTRPTMSQIVPDPNYSFLDDCTQQAALPPGGTITVEAPYDNGIYSQGEIDNPVELLYVFGRVHYRDLFGPHLTEYCGIYTKSRFERGLTTIPACPDRFNRME